MPRKVVPPTVAAPLPPPPPSPIVQRLRQDWRWAGISQFFYTFSDAFGLSDWDIEALERDFDGTEQAMIPDIIAKLLYALTWNRQINRGNAFEHLLRQYLKRDPDNTVLGTEEAPVAWETLGLDHKVQILWQLCEWQLSDPARFRSLLPSESDAPSWRVDPIGWDRTGNTYFLFDDNRLWIQRTHPSPPRPRKKTSQKAKKAQQASSRSKPPPKRSHKKREPKARPVTPPPKVEDDEPASGRRKRKQVVFYGNVTPTVDALKSESKTRPTPPSSRATRASARSAVNTPSKSAPAPPLPRGTRVSRRLHTVDDEWQAVPDEWLSRNQPPADTRKEAEDDESELSDLSDDEPITASKDDSDDAPPTAGHDSGNSSDSALSEAPSAGEGAGSVDAEQADGDSDGLKDEASESDGDEEQDDEFELGLKEATNLPEGFIEWEAVCVSLYDWKTFPEQFAKSKHPDEKAFYKLLSAEVAPQIVDVLEVKEQERLKQEAINNRKRSSRIAMRELEREEQQRQERAQREMEERMERLRQEETRKEMEEQEALSKERAREERLREREERLAARERAIHERAESEARQREQRERAREKRKRRREGEEVSDDDESAPLSRAGTSAPSEGQGSWELKCEVCKLHGWNLNDESDVVCCDDCGRWQHMPCHDRQDKSAGRKPRDWDSVDFRECELRANQPKRPKMEPDAAPPQVGPALHPPTNGHPLGVNSLLNAAPVSNGSQSSEYTVGPPQRSQNGLPEVYSGNEHQLHQQIPRGHGVPLPPLSHPHADAQAHIRHLPAAPTYAHLPERLPPTGYGPPFPPPTQAPGVYGRELAQQYTNGPGHLPGYGDGRLSFPHQPHQLPPVQAVHRHHQVPYAGPPLPPLPPPPHHYSHQTTPSAHAGGASGAQTATYPAPVHDQRLYGDGRPS